MFLLPLEVNSSHDRCHTQCDTSSSLSKSTMSRISAILHRNCNISEQLGISSKEKKKISETPYTNFRGWSGLIGTNIMTRRREIFLLL